MRKLSLREGRLESECRAALLLPPGPESSSSRFPMVTGVVWLVQKEPPSHCPRQPLSFVGPHSKCSLRSESLNATVASASKEPQSTFAPRPCVLPSGAPEAASHQ